MASIIELAGVIGFGAAVAVGGYNVAVDTLASAVRTAGAADTTRQVAASLLLANPSGTVSAPAAYAAAHERGVQFTNGSSPGSGLVSVARRGDAWLIALRAGPGASTCEYAVSDVNEPLRYGRSQVAAFEPCQASDAAARATDTSPRPALATPAS